MNGLTRTALAATVALALVGCRAEVDLPAPGDPAPPAEPEVTVPQSTAAPGTEITVEARGFSPGTDVQIGLGMPASDYSVVRQETTDAAGELSLTLQVPDWTMRGHPYVVVVEEPGMGGERAVSDPFVVGEPGDRVTVPGTLTDEGVECPAMRGPGGTLYTLAVTELEWGPGTDVHVEGRIAEAAICMQGTTLEVESIRRR